MCADSKKPTRPTQEDLDANKLIVDAFMDDRPKEAAVTMKRPRCKKCGCTLITAVERLTAGYPFDNFHVGWWCQECAVYVGHETENLIAWLIFASVDGSGSGPLVLLSPDHTMPEDET